MRRERRDVHDRPRRRRRAGTGHRGSEDWLGRTVPWKLRLTTSSIAIVGSSKKDRSPAVAAATLPPAALTSTSTRPQRRAPFARARSSWLDIEHVGLDGDRRVTEALCELVEPFAPPCEEADFAPAATSPRAIAPPRTPDAPVTTATCPPPSETEQLETAVIRGVFHARQRHKAPGTARPWCTRYRRRAQEANAGALGKGALDSGAQRHTDPVERSAIEFAVNVANKRRATSASNDS